MGTRQRLMVLFMKLLGATVLVLAIFIGSLYSGALVSTGVFSMLDQFEGSRGYFMKGLFPAMHADTAWGFTEDQIPDLEGTTVVVTGANSGLGFWSARHLAAKKATVVLTCRDTKRCEQAVAKIRESIGPEINPNLIPMKLDLASFTSIRAFANAFKNKFTRLDSMILNAGLRLSLTSLSLTPLSMHHACPGWATRIRLPSRQTAGLAG